MSPAHIEVGKIEEGESKWAFFNVRNSSASPVEVKKLSTTCGCTTAYIDSTLLAPGAETIVRAEMSNIDRIKRFGATVSVEWVDTKTGQGGLAAGTVAGDPAFVVRRSPQSIDFKNVEFDSPPVSLAVRLTRGNSDLAWNSLESEELPSNPSIGLKRVSEDEYLLEAKLNPEGENLGHFRRPVKLRFVDTTTGASLVREVDIQGVIWGPVKASPKSLFFGAMKGGEVAAGKISLSRADGSPAQVESIAVEGDNPEAIVIGEAVGAGSSVEIPYKFQPGRQRGSLSGNLLIRMKGVPSLSIVVPFMGYSK
jgi:hypothetical protein